MEEIAILRGAVGALREVAARRRGERERRPPRGVSRVVVASGISAIVGFAWVAWVRR
jgi:hypothetical protein